MEAGRSGGTAALLAAPCPPSVDAVRLAPVRRWGAGALVIPTLGHQTGASCSTLLWHRRPSPGDCAPSTSLEGAVAARPAAWGRGCGVSLVSSGAVAPALRPCIRPLRTPCSTSLFTAILTALRRQPWLSNGYPL